VRSLKLLSSLRLTVALLGFAMVLIFVATISQVELGIHEVQQKFFRSWIAWWDIMPGEKKVPIPIPGGTLLGSLLVLNLLAAQGARFKLSWNKAGMIVIHSGILLLLLGELFTGLLGREAQMTLNEGQILNYSTFPREVELVVIRPDSDGLETVTAIPQGRLKDGAEFPLGGFSVKVRRYFANSEILPESEATESFDQTRATEGTGKEYAVCPKPREAKDDRRDVAAAFVEVVPDGGKSQGIWLLSNAFKGEQAFAAAGRPWKMALRQRRLYHDFSIKLVDFSHDRYLGTDVPKNFSSKIRILNPDTGENREDLIYMNHPLRYGGFTFYQAGFENNDSTSIFQVVLNPVWTLPYIACVMVGLGLLWVFFQHLLNAVSRRRVIAPEPTKVWKTVVWLLPTLCLLVVAAAVFKATRPSTGLDFKNFGSLPVVSNGRVQPLDSLARNALLAIHGKQRVPGEDAPASPAAWLAELNFSPALADTRKIFLIHHDDLLGLTKLTRSEEKSYSYAQLLPSFPALQQEARRIGVADSKTWSPYEKALMLLTRNLTLYNQLKHALALPGQDHLESEFGGFLDEVSVALAEVDKQDRGVEFNQAAIDSASARMRTVVDWAPMTEVYTTPSGEGVDGWRKLPDSLIDGIDKHALHPSTLAYARLGDAYRARDTSAFNSAVKDYREWLAESRPGHLKKSSSEALFNAIEPFYFSMILYVVAFLCAVTSWLWHGSSLRKAAFRVLLIGLSLHTLGLVTRMMLEGRPPVTNLYSSAIFIGWGAIVLSAFLEVFYRNAIGTVVASVVAFATLLIAHHLSLSGDTLEMMRAVLDTNFWLATHVVVITLGYASTFLAGTIAIVYLLLRAFGRVPDSTSSSLRGMVYGVICFATLASFVGTVLGGIWADQSWGRFWGWDPKENGALLIVIWNAIILHARWGGMIRERGMMVMAVFGNIVTSWSWFGTNMLGIGLHSYGFTDAAFFWLSSFMISQALLMALGLIGGRNSKSTTGKPGTGNSVNDAPPVAP